MAASEAAASRMKASKRVRAGRSPGSPRARSVTKMKRRLSRRPSLDDLQALPPLRRPRRSTARAHRAWPRWSQPVPASRGAELVDGQHRLRLSSGADGDIGEELDELDAVDPHRPSLVSCRRVWRRSPRARSLSTRSRVTDRRAGAGADQQGHRGCRAGPPDRSARPATADHVGVVGERRCAPGLEQGRGELAVPRRGRPRSRRRGRPRAG